MDDKSGHDELVKEVSGGLSRFVSVLAATGPNDYIAKAKLFRELESIARDSAEMYEVFGG